MSGRYYEMRAHQRALCEKLFGSYSIWRRRLQVWLVLGGILVAGFGEIFSNILDPPLKFYFGSAWAVGLFIAFVGGIVLVALDDGGPDILFHAQEAIESLEAADGKLVAVADSNEWALTLHAISIVFRDFVEEAIVNGHGSEDTLHRSLVNMLDILVEHKGILFDIDDEMWNFSVYIYDETDRVLRSKACRRAIRAEETEEHREWAPGEGHVGMAFLKRKPVIAADTMTAEVASLFSAPEEKRKPEDDKRYRSVAAIPIGLKYGSCIGVLVATSDHVGRFSYMKDDSGRDSVEAVRILASAIAMLCRASYLVGLGGRTG